MQGLLRLAGWGVAATAALLFVVIAANSTAGRERLSVAFAGVNGTRAAETAKAEALQAAQMARLATTEADTRRLVEIVRALAGDREQLLTRLASIERNLEDVTGSIQKQAAAPPASPPPAPPTEAPPKTVAVPPPTVAPAEPTSSPSEPPNRTGSLPPAGVGAGSMPELEAIQGRAQGGVDVGGAKDFDGLRTLWNTLTTNHFGLFDGLHPIVAVRENSKSRTAELRLVAGPLTDVEIAGRICSTLAAAKRYCRLAAFEGQPLALHGEPPRRPAAKARPTQRATP